VNAEIPERANVPRKVDFHGGSGWEGAHYSRRKRRGAAAAGAAAGANLRASRGARAALDPESAV
jgi:hypothetical protein